MENVPFYISTGLAFTTFLTAFIFFKAANNSKRTLLILTGWLVLQAIIGLSGFYTVSDTLPPRFMLTIVPPLAFIAVLFVTKKGLRFIDNLNMKTLTLLHTVRIPVELILFGLFMYKTIPQLMTFEGRNFDIIAGLTAPLIYYYGFVKNKLNRKVLLAWNFICLALLLNIVSNAVLAAPFPFQQFAFEQPNIAVLYFPYVWLPACVVPLVLFSHLVSIRQLIKEKVFTKKITYVTNIQA
jgi:hypothetical protein